MLQAFVSLKQQQPPRTEPGLKAFFDGVVKATYSAPTYFCTNVDTAPQPFTVEQITEACRQQGCKWALVRGEEPYWQATILMPDKQGNAALFFHLEENDDGEKMDEDMVVAFAKRLYHELQPMIVRVGDSEGREKLRSKFGLSLMPGLGRVDWLQIVHPDVYEKLYNVSELEAAPAYTVETLEDRALFLRVYGDPKDWNNDDNISLANMIPGFLAGIVKIQDSASEREAVRRVEKLWTRASKTADRAAKVFKPPSPGPGARPAAQRPSRPAAQPAQPAQPAAQRPSRPAAQPAQPAAQRPSKPAAQPAQAKPAKPSFTLPEQEAVEPPAEERIIKPDTSVAEVSSRPTREVDADAAASAVSAASVEPSPISEPEPEVMTPQPAPVVEPEMATPQPAPVVEPEPEPEPERLPEPSAAEVATAAQALNVPDFDVDPTSVRKVADAGLDVPIYQAHNRHGEGHACYIAFNPDPNQSGYHLLDREEDFAWFLPAVGLGISERDQARVVELTCAYHRPYLRLLSAVSDLPGEAGRDPRLEDYRGRVKAPFIDVSEQETHQLHLWMYNPRLSSLEELIIQQYEDWPLTMESKRHVVDLKAPPATAKPATAPSSASTPEPAGPKKAADPVPTAPAKSVDKPQPTAPTKKPAPGQPTPTREQTSGGSMGLVIGLVVGIVVGILLYLFVFNT